MENNHVPEESISEHKGLYITIVITSLLMCAFFVFQEMETEKKLNIQIHRK